jgi:hypothetical protein
MSNGHSGGAAKGGLEALGKVAKTARIYMPMLPIERTCPTTQYALATTLLRISGRVHQEKGYQFRLLRHLSVK